ncbi:hypothetical protein QBC46DRAFT_6054 [Diplogelasinospora grovesii]|uniref:Uncharacterized protein n=1 Tax=Diplogelasinospora grovesii TaxID=303347 RepID=A0AAN6NIH1_9PEZI|nr:hypothetical protein QBC46DRAFT_6054 [Diplogelasinospora grovesii]
MGGNICYFFWYLASFDLYQPIYFIPLSPSSFPFPFPLSILTPSILALPHLLYLFLGKGFIIYIVRQSCGGQRAYQNISYVYPFLGRARRTCLMSFFIWLFYMETAREDGGVCGVNGVGRKTKIGGKRNIGRFGQYVNLRILLLTVGCVLGGWEAKTATKKSKTLGNTMHGEKSFFDTVPCLYFADTSYYYCLYPPYAHMTYQ